MLPGIGNNNDNSGGGFFLTDIVDRPILHKSPQTQSNKKFQNMGQLSQTPMPLPIHDFS